MSMKWSSSTGNLGGSVAEIQQRDLITIYIEWPPSIKLSPHFTIDSISGLFFGYCTIYTELLSARLHQLLVQGDEGCGVGVVCLFDFSFTVTHLCCATFVIY